MKESLLVNASFIPEIRCTMVSMNMDFGWPGNYNMLNTSWDVNLLEYISILPIHSWKERGVGNYYDMQITRNKMAGQ